MHDTENGCHTDAGRQRGAYRIDPHGWLQPAKCCPSENFNQRPADAHIELLVIHNISLPAGCFGNGYIEALFTNRLDCSIDPSFEDLSGLQVSAHLLIDRCGAITQFVSFDARAWHAGQSRFGGRDNCNDFSIGIELEGTDTLPYADAQYASLAAVAQVLCGRYPGIVPQRIVGHSDIAPGRKSDPGPAFDWPRFRRMLDSGVDR
ncbi:MAG TPA: 1,6-anhydro-N-acetylmuramyl-L-alanine amidase AmpD [Spongiibacteraceae bacterium]|nr:1,6-anhydro-N-acetylmuramyl-L-alanine amidase AmpD [Spongiibacteraceae bacterium]